MPLSPHEQRCLELAERAIGLSDPNPRVGCVIVTTDGQRIEGHTQAAGQAHAEAHALQLARQRGLNVEGATVWVSLEPCCHQGRTPACHQALINAGVGQVHVATLDPNPRVAGQGVAHLRAAGIAVFVDEGDWARQAWALNIGFFSRMIRQRPWVRMKIAASLDGTTALNNGQSQWITSAAARHDGHGWRRRASAILTGIGTVRDDDPRLDVRGFEIAQQPLRVVVDSRLEIDPGARVLQPPGTCRLYTTRPPASAPEALRAVPGLSIVQLPVEPGPTTGKTDLAALLVDLAQHGVNELHVEAGEKLNGSWIRAGLVDELLLYLAPRLLGPGRGLAGFASAPLESLSDHVALSFLDTAAVGTDLRVRALTASGAAFFKADPSHPTAAPPVA